MAALGVLLRRSLGAAARSSPPSSRTVTRHHSLHTLLHRRAHHQLSRSPLYSSNGQALRLQQHSRQISYSFIPRMIFRASTRLPVIALGGTAAGGAYVLAKVDAARNSVNDSLNEAWQTVGGALGKAGSMLGQAGSALGETADEANKFGSGVWYSVRTFLGSMMEGTGEATSGGDGVPPPPELTPEGPGQGGSNGKGVRAAATAAALPLLVNEEEDDGDVTDQATNDLMMLTKKLIEIRSILLSIDQKESLQLPAIVVVGSQSSGKSSVLEAIVGREFLPKGNNMVTRRPIELTLVHTPPTPNNPHPKTFAEFPSFAPGQHILDFSQVQKTLLDLNLSIPSSQAVSSIPVELRIHSPHVPDLSLVDLPGYIELSSMDQPDTLKEEIANLCEKYIKPPNVILAVCAADVDLANSPALRASRRVDPLGMRTIGVVTKMDLVEPKQGADILTNKRYPLALGYVGVVCKAVAKQREGRDFLRLKNTPEDEGLIAPVRRQEQAFFGGNKEDFSREGIQVTTDLLKRRLMQVLEESMANSLHGISNTVALELEEARYQFKVQYNDRTVSPEAYMAETLDVLKHRLARFKDSYGKPQVRRMLKSHLDDAAMEVLARYYWVDATEETSMANLTGVPQLVEETRAKRARMNPDNAGLKASQLPDPQAPWKRKLDAASSGLTKSGVGRTSTQLVVEAIRSHISNGLMEEEPLASHISTAERINNFSDAILREKYAATAELIETCIKPYKHEVELDPEGREWEKGRNEAIELLNREIQIIDSAVGHIRETVGGSRKLKNAMQYLADLEHRQKQKLAARRAAVAQRMAAGDADYSDVQAELLKEDAEDPTRPAYSPILITKAREARDLTGRTALLKARINALKSKQCYRYSEKNADDMRIYCPEAFLNVVADKLATTAVQFVNIELLQEYFHLLPRQIETQLGYSQSPSEILEFARENPKFRKHLDLQERKEKLELVSEKLNALLRLQQERQGPIRQPTGNRREGNRRFSLF